MFDVVQQSSRILYSISIDIVGFLFGLRKGEKDKRFIDLLNNRLKSHFPKFHRILTIFGPLIWPGRNTFIQLNIAAVFVTIVLGCIVNLYVPVYGKKIVDSLSWNAESHNITQNNNEQNVPFNSNGKLHFRWDYIFIYVGLKILQGVGPLSLLNCAQSFLWVNIQQFNLKNIQVYFFEHVHSLSARWHTNTKTSDILAALDLGTESLNSILEHIILCLLPTIIDIIIAVYYLSSIFSFWFGIAVLVQIIVYLVVTVWFTEWRMKFQEIMNNADHQRRHQALESLLNFETVKYFANESYETKKFGKTITKVHATQWKATISMISLQLIQLIIINMGHLFGSLVLCWMICNGKDNTLSVGDYILFTVYLSQLYGPLNYLGTYYREVRTGIVDLEYMLEILNVNQEVQDSKYAGEVKMPTGQIEFKNVTFGYDNQINILKNVSFIIPAKKVVALVGHSGSGKTSIMKLLLRCYDVTDGEILIDDENIKNVTQKSLRRAIGVVPQDTVLFNETLKHNIKYSQLEAEDSEVIAASKGSCIHETISKFPEGYSTVVGERGLKLSGGEKQRVTIARILLKNPKILIFDEATSALDANTEKEIQTSLEKLCRKRTSLIITHKLSTIKHADEILVLKNGVIIERGRHNELLKKSGEYASMWHEQNKQ